jgi:hypothetical protein
MPMPNTRLEYKHPNAVLIILFIIAVPHECIGSAEAGDIIPPFQEKKGNVLEKEQPRIFYKEHTPSEGYITNEHGNSTRKWKKISKLK